MIPDTRAPKLIFQNLLENPAWSQDDHDLGINQRTAPGALVSMASQDGSWFDLYPDSKNLLETDEQTDRKSVV